MANFELENYEGQESEVMEMDQVAMEPEAEDAGLSTGAAMLIGGGLALAITAGIKWIVGKVKEHKAKQAEKAAEEEKPAEIKHDFVEPTDEEIQKVTKAK